MMPKLPALPALYQFCANGVMSTVMKPPSWSVADEILTTVPGNAEQAGAFRPVMVSVDQACPAWQTVNVPALPPSCTKRTTLAF